jgi:short-subunit dehydrogenase involved in D-alanine esterification of teichoic acids
MKILASIYAESTDQDKRDKAKEFLKKVTQHDAHDIDSWIQLAEILEGPDLQGISKLLSSIEDSIEIFSQAPWMRI